MTVSLKKIKIMKKQIVFLLTILGCTLYGQVSPGTYLGFGAGSHYTVSVSPETILIEPCKKYESPLSTANETYEFKKLAGTDQFGWKGYSEVILQASNKSRRIDFKDPINLKDSRSFQWMSNSKNLPAQGVKTYIDETFGGYSVARVLIPDPSSIPDSKCLIHGVAKSDLNHHLIGSYRGLFDENWKAQFNADYSGTFIGLPMTWTLVSDREGNVIKWDIPNSESVVFYVMVEYEGKLPMTFDPVDQGKKVAGIYSAFYNDQTGQIEIHQMVK